jgi:hypothetical protein
VSPVTSHMCLSGTDVICTTKGMVHIRSAAVPVDHRRLAMVRLAERIHDRFPEITGRIPGFAAAKRPPVYVSYV